MISNILLQSCFLLGAVAADGEVSQNDFDTAARNYRITVYNRFHTDRAEYDRLQELGKRAEESWRRASETQRVETFDWFKVSATSALSGQATAVNELPYWPVPQSDKRAIVSRERASFQRDTDHDVVDRTQQYDAEKEQSKLTSVLQSVGNAIGTAVGGRDAETEDVGQFDVNIRGPKTEEQVSDVELPIRQEARELPATAPEFSEEEFAAEETNESNVATDDFATTEGEPTLAVSPVAELLEGVKTVAATESEMTSVVERVEELYWQRALAGDTSAASKAEFAKVVEALQGRLGEVSEDVAGGLLERVDALTAQ